MSCRNFLCRQRRSKQKIEKKTFQDDGHNRLDLKSSKFNGNYILLVPKIKLQNFKNR